MIRQWIDIVGATMLGEASGKPKQPRIAVHDVNDRVRRIMRDMPRVGRSEIQSAYDDIMASAAFKDGKMVVYRGMTIEDRQWLANLKSGDNLGRYWAYQRAGALVGSWSEPNVLFVALVDPTQIDWAITVAQEIAVGGEYEITLGGVPVVLQSIEMLDGSRIDFAHLYGQKFWT